MMHSVSKAGKDSEENWRTCSMLTNAIKSHWTLEQLGWEELPVGDIALWDGMLRWFLDCMEQNQELLQDTYFKRWYGAALDVNFIK